MDFYLIVAPGLEVQALNEMKEVWPYLIGKDGQSHTTSFPELHIDRGGIEFSTDEILAYQLNFFLKTPTRLLKRLKKFRTRDFPKVFQELNKINWSSEFDKSLAVAINVAAQKSRLNNEKRILGVAEEVLKKQKYSIADEASQNLYIRMFDDECTISIDTSGEMLYKRGWGTLKGEAPVRESIAAFGLRELISETPLVKSQQVTLVDPFCGSGTLLLEALTLYIPHWHREFSFLQIPSAPKLFKSSSWRMNYKISWCSPFSRVIGGDIDSATIVAAEKNFSSAETLLKSALPSGFDYTFSKSICSELAVAADNGEGWIISNPPYGDRVDLVGGGTVQSQILEMIQNSKDVNFSKIALLLPVDEAARVEFQGYEKTKELPVSNGGLKTVWTVWCKI